MAAEQHLCERHHRPAVASRVRPLRRAIQRTVENELSRLVLGGKANAGERVYIDALEGELHFDGERDGVAESRKAAAEPEAVGS